MTSNPIVVMTEGPIIDTDALVAFLREEEETSRDECVDDERAVALDFYNGEPFGDEDEGLSQVVTRDVAEVIDYMTVSLLRTMVSGDQVVEFDCPDKKVAEEATAAVSYQFFQGQDGYRFLHDWIKSGLLEKTSTAKCCVVDQQPVRQEAVIPAEAISLLVAEGAEIIDVQAVDELGTQVAVAFLEPQPPEFRDYVVPNEECDVAQDTRDLDEDGVYIGFKTPKTISQLAEMGFETEDLTDESFGEADSILAAARDDDRNFWRSGFNRDGPNRKVWYREEYARYDLNDDGIAELLLIHRVGSKILQWADREPDGFYGTYAIQEVDEQPGVDWCPFPAASRRVGQSLADKVMDIQRTNSVVLRQVLNGFYFANNPRTYINETSLGDSTIDDLLTVRPGGIVRWKGQIKPETNSGSFDMSAGLALMEKLQGEKESRTGITRLNQGLDADALNKTATGTALMQAQGQQMEEYLARNFAEAFARLMLKKYRLMRRFGRAMTLSIDGEVRQVDPRTWPEEMKVQVRVGLGSGRKDQRLQYRMMVLDIMKQAVEGGSRIVTDEGIYNMTKGVIADANLGNVRDYLVDPATLPPEEEQPNPAMVEAQAKAMLDAQKLDADKQKSQADFMLRAREQEATAALKQQQNEYDLQAKREKAALDEQLAREKAAFEAGLAERQFQFESAMALRQQEFNEGLARQKSASAEADALPKKREGGDLDK